MTATKNDSIGMLGIDARNYFPHQQFLRGRYGRRGWTQSAGGYAEYVSDHGAMHFDRRPAVRGRQDVLWENYTGDDSNKSTRCTPMYIRYRGHWVLPEKHSVKEAVFGEEIMTAEVTMIIAVMILATIVTP